MYKLYSTEATLRGQWAVCLARQGQRVPTECSRDNRQTNERTLLSAGGGGFHVVAHQSCKEPGIGRCYREAGVGREVLKRAWFREVL